MGESSEIIIPVKVPVMIESSDALPELTKVTDGVDNLRTALDILKNSNQESVIPGFIKGMDEQISITEDNVNSLIQSRKRIDTASSNQERDILQKNFIQAYNRAIRSVQDLFKGIQASNDLGQMLTNEVKDVFTDALRPAATDLRRTLSDTARTLSRKSGNQTIDSIIGAAINSDEIMKILVENGLDSSKGVNEQTIRKYLQAISPYAVPKMFNAQYLDWEKGEKSKPLTIAERLPSKTRRLFTHPNNVKPQVDNDSYFLTEKENKKMQDYLTAHPYMLREAEQAGIVHRENGNIYYNPNTTRAHVGAFGGNVVEMFASGIKGGPSTGYVDARTLSPQESRHALNKSNLYTTSSEHAANFLESNFSWYKPEHVANQKQAGFKPSSNGWTNIGKVTGDPRIDAMEFYEINLDDIKNGKITIPEWDKDTPYEERPYIRVNRSLMQNVLSRQKGATPFYHNGFNNNEIYIKLPNEELSNYETTPERIAEIREKMAAAVSASLDDMPYEFTGFTGTHMVLTRKDLIDEIKKNPETKDFFLNGNPNHIFKEDYESFARANAYAKLLRTEGADVEEQYGTDLRNISVVVGDLKKATGLDGQRLVSGRYFPQSFQHRDFGGKGTSQAIDLDALWKMYPERIAQEDIPEEGIHKGDLVFPRGGYGDTDESPRKLILPQGVGVVEDSTLLKTKGRYAGMSQSEINDARTKEMRQYGVLTKTSGEGFNTPVSYISSQEASTLQLTPEAIDYFKAVGIKSLRELNDPDAVKRILFSGNDPLSKIVQEDEGFLALPESQERISEYRKKLNSLMRGANLILPHNSAQYSMLQAWVPDIFNQLIGNDNLTAEERRMSLSSLKKDSSVDDVVAYFGAKDADILQLYRNPSTAGGNIAAGNAAVDDFFQNLATTLGLDQKALYTDPSSEILTRMQTADFDGDTVFVQALKSNETLRHIMLPVLAATAERYKAIKEASGYSDEEQDDRAKSRWKKLIDDSGQTYDFDNPIDRINWYINSKKRDAKMGLSNAISLSARQYKTSEAVAKATRDVQDHYDAVSNSAFKENKDYEVTPEEWAIARGGSPFYQLHNWIDKASSIEYVRGEKSSASRKELIDYDSINRRSIDKLNFESIYDPNAKLAAMRNYIANNLYPEEQEEYNKVIDDVFEHLPEIDASTAQGQFQQAMRDLRKRRAKGEWLVMDQPTISRMDALSLKAYKEIQEAVEKDGSIDARHEVDEINKRYAEIGGNAYENEKLFGFTGAFYRDEEFKKEMADLARESSTSHVFSSAKWVPNEITDWEKQRREAEKRYNEKKAEVERLQKEEEERIKKQEEFEKRSSEIDKKEKEQKDITKPTERESYVQDTSKQVVPAYEPSDIFKQAVNERESMKQPTNQPAQIKQTPHQGGFGPNAANNAAAIQKAAEEAEIAKQVLNQYNNMAPAVSEIGRVKDLLDEQLRSFRNGIIKKEHQLEGTSEAQLYFGKQIGITTSLKKEIDSLLSETNTETQAVFNSGVVGQELKASLQAGKRQLQIGLYEDFFDWAELQAKNTVDGIDELLDKEINKPSKQKENFDKKQQEIEELRKTRQMLLNRKGENGYFPLGKDYTDSTLTGRTSEENGQIRLGDLREKALSENEAAIRIADDKLEDLQNYYTTINESTFEDTLNDLALKIDPALQKNSPEVLSRTRLSMISKARETLEKHKKENFYSQDMYESHLARLNQLEELSSVEAIASEQESKNRLRQTQNDISYNRFMRQGGQLQRSRYGGSRGIAARAMAIHENALAQYENRYLTAQRMIADKEVEIKGINKEAEPERYAKATSELENLKSASSSAKAEMEQLSKTGITAGDAFASFGQSIQMVAHRLGRQLFQKALQETKRFVKEFDASMNEIQAITLKSDKEMQGIRSQTINKALGLRTSVSNVSNVEAALYRQGLSDQEVSARTESIIKFATVTKLKVEDATKIITTALQNDLVASANEAMDALVALGDSAATTAAEIGKGMQKAAASAKVAGVSYAELTALLTIGTSDTQLSGTQVGTALQTVFTRMRRMSLSGWTADQNGEKTTASDAEAALRSVGIDLFEDKNQQRMRNAYDVMNDLAKVWQKLSDVQKSVVTSALAGTRQTNIFSTLMEGMSEEDGKRLQEYLDLATGSTGITENKYDIAMKSLAASMDELKSSWDSLIASFTNNGTITGILDSVSSGLQWIADLGNNGGQIGIGLAAVAGGLTAIFTAIKLMKSFTLPGFVMTLIELAAGFLVGGGVLGLTSIVHPKPQETESERLARESTADLESINVGYRKNSESLSNRRKVIDEAQDKYDAYIRETNDGNKNSIARARAELISTMNDLGKAFPDIVPEVQNATSNLENFSTALDSARKAAEREAERISKDTDNRTQQHQQVYGQQEYEEGAKNIIGSFDYGLLDRHAIQYINEAGGDTSYYDDNGYTGFHEFVQSYADSQSFFKDSENPTEDKARAITNLFNNDELATRILGSYFENDDTILSLLKTDPRKVTELDASDQRLLASAYDDFWRYRFKINFDNYDYLAEKDLFNNDYINRMVGQWNLSNLATDEVGESAIKKIFAEKLFEEITDENGNIKDEYYLDPEAHQLNIGAISGKIREIKDRGSESLLEGYTTEDLNSYKTTVDNAVAASLIDLRKNQPINQQRSDLIKAINSAESLSALKTSYESQDKAQEFANVLANSPELLSAYMMLTGENPTMTWDEFQKFAGTTEIGHGTNADLARVAIAGLNKDKTLATSFRQDDVFSQTYKVLQSVFGDLTDDILNEYETGTVSKETENYINRTLEEKSIKTGTGKQFTNVQTSQLARTVFDIGDWTKAQETSSKRGWTTDEWSVLESKYPGLKQYLQMTPEQRASQEGLNLERDIKIQIDVAGISDLEEAGKLLDGTYDAVQKLKKGGRFAIEVISKYRSEGFEQGQQTAKLYNGNVSQQDEAAMAILGMSREQYYSNRKANYKAAQAADTQNRKLNANTWAALYKNATTAEDKQAILDAAKSAGYEYVGVTFKDNEQLPSFAFKGIPGLANVGSLAGTEKAYTDKEKSEMLAGILAGSVTRNANNSTLFDEAVGMSGQYTRELLRQWQNSGSEANYADWLRSANINEETKRLAKQETELTQKQIEEADALEKARLSSGSLTGMLAYQQVQREQQNKGAYAADKLFASLDENKINNFSDLMNVFNGEQSDNWKDLIESSPDLAKKLSDLGVKVGENGLDFSAVESSGYELADVLDMLKASVAGASNEFDKFAKVESVGDKYNKAMAFLSGEQMVDETEGFEALKEIYGNEAIAQTVYNNRPENGLLIEPTDYFENGYAYDSHGKLLGTKEEYLAKAAARQGYNKYEGLEGYDLAYAQQLEENAKYGITGLTDVNRMSFFQQLLEDARNGNLTSIREGDKTGFYSDVVGALSGGANYLQMVETLQKKGLDYTDFANIKEGSDAYQQLQEAFEGTGHTAEEFLESQKQIDTELKSASIVALRTYGKESEKVADTYKKLNGTIEEQLGVQKQMNKNRIALGNATYYTSGKGSKDYSKVAKEFLGYSKEDIAALEKSLGKDKTKLQIQQEAELQLSVDRQQVINDANAVIQNTIDEIGGVKYEDIKFLIGGTYDISQLSQMAEGLTGDAKTIIDAILTHLANMEGSVTFGGSADVNGDTGTLTVSSKNIKTSGGGFKTSGGGGGGKSATDKLLENQKRKLAELEHQQKMLEIAEKGLDFSNDYSGWNTNLDDQIVVQEKLRAQYAANIKEMNEMLKKVKEGSDDWYKLKEAIMSAEEAMASVSNTINEINEKRISILAQEQENADKPDAHRLSMQQKYAARYQKSDQFEGYVAMTEAAIETTRKQIEQNNSQIKDWEDMLLQFEENSDSWIETRDNIWKLKEENADLENQVASDMIDLEEAKIAQIAKDLENAQSPYQHAVNMLETYGGMYQSMNNQGAYRGTLQDTIANNNQLKALNDAAIEELKKQIEGMQESDPARQSAISTLYQLEEASAKYEASMLANQQAIEESLISELKTTYSDSGSILEHELKLLSEAEKEFLRDDDFVNYENILQEETRNASERIELQKQALEEYLALQSSGQITEGSQQWNDLEETIRTAEESIASYSNEYEDLIDKLQNAKFENLQKTFNEADELAQHNLKMIQYEETRYQNRGELTNYGILLAQDTEMQGNRANEIRDYIENLKEMQATVEDNPALYKKVTQEIYKWEEQLSSINNTIEKNEELLHKNEEAIRKVRKAVEDTVDKEIRARIQKERDMLAATVQVENSILDVIRKNYEQQWALQKRDLDKKKQALNEEKSLINERLNARKDAINQEEKYEEVAELRRQYALIASDTTRTKDAAELREKIKNLQQEISWDLATDEANAATQAIDDQIKAIDNYVSTYEEDLNEMLSDSNNFRDDLNTIMGGSFEDFLGWMQENNESYKLATADARATMEQGWEDTWKKMKGEIDTYWNEVDESMRSREGFLAYMQNSDTYKTASQTGQQSLLSYWGDMYDDYTASLINDANFDHTHEILDKVDELKDWTFNVRMSELDGYDINPWSDYVYNRRTDYDPYVDDDDYSGRGKQPEPAPTPEPTPAPSGGGKKGKSSYTATVWYATGSGYIDKVSATGDTYSAAEKAAYNAVPRNAMYAHNKKTYVEKYVEDLGKREDIRLITAATPITKNDNGGLMDYTGLAWVDGTKTKPESFLDSTDTALLRSMLDTFTYVKNAPYMSHVSSDMFGRPNVSIGDVNVNLYEAKLEDDADYNKIATKVGEVFTKELQKNGMNIANYSW